MQPAFDFATRLTGWLIVFILVMSSWGQLVVRGQSVEVRQGNVYYKDSKGKSSQITSEGIDLDASLSADGKSIVFVRKTGLSATFEEPTEPHPFQHQILIANIGNSRSFEVVLGGPLTLKDGSDYASFSTPQISPDNQSVYFLIPASVTVGGLVRIDRRTKKVEFLSPALSFYVVPQGRYRGDIVTKIRRPIGDGLVNYFWLLDSNGAELGFVGETEEDAKRFLGGSQNLRKAP